MASTNTPAKKKDQAPAAPAVPINHSERFTAMVLREFGSNVAGSLDVTDQQRRLIQGYFIAIDRALKAAEEKRDQNKNPLPFGWENVNLVDLALDVVTCARLGLDMRQDNHLFAIPYKNNRTQKYDITLMKGYAGIQYIAEKYALNQPKAVTTELVYSTDTFVVHKKSVTNTVETYEFEITNPFERGELVGAFGYIEYEDKTKNKLVLMSRRDIEKRKPQYASKQFWGDGPGSSTGWYEEMCLKTLKREVYSGKHMPVDPAKIDEDYQLMRLREARYAEMEAQAEIDANANGDVIDVDGLPSAAPAALPSADGGGVTLPACDPATGEVLGSATTGNPVPDGQQTISGPSF